MKLFTRAFIFFSLFFGVFASDLLAQTTGDYRSNAATFNWNAAASWQRWNGASWTNNPGEGYPGENVSGIAGTVTILNTHTVTLNVSPLQSIGNLVIASGGTFVGGNFTLITTGNFTNNGGTFTPSTSTITFTGSGAQAINGSAASQAFNNLVINKANTLTVGGSTTTLNVVNLTRQAGNFTAPATMNISGSVLLTAGTYTAGANTNVGGDFTNNGGTFTPGGGNTVTFNGAGAQAINGSAASLAFTNLFINKAGSSTVTVGGSIATVTVTTLTQTLGNFTAPATVTASTPGIFTLNAGTYTAGANTNIVGNFINNGATFLPGANTVTFSGAGAKTIGGTSPTTFNNLTLSSTLAANVTLSNSIRVDGVISWTTDGLLVVGTNDVTLGSAASVVSPTTSRYIQLDGTADANSQLIRVNNNTIAAWQFLFPIGTATGGYTPLDLSTAATTISTAPTTNSTLAVKAILSADAVGRLKRTFRITVAGNSNNTTIAGGLFYYSSVTDPSFAESLASYNNFWYQRESNGVWSSPGGTAPGAGFFTGPSGAQPLTNDTYFFTIGTPTAYGRTWYSYQSGNWSNPLTWTLDGGVFPVILNPTNTIPIGSDNVVITSGRIVSMDINNTSITGITVIGTLDVLATTGHSFTTISGTGNIRIAGATDNFPAGTATNFADNAVGGTVEVNGTAISLNAARTFNNMIINMTGSTDVATLLQNITLNGNLTITNGLLRFSNNAAAVNRNFTVNGNVSISITGGIRTGTDNARHEFNLYGDFTNAGTANFTNRVVANTAMEATDGIVDVNFLGAIRNQQVSCNGVTNFYRVEINKGIDDTYRATFTASAAANFNLFGAANYDINTASGSNLNALGLTFGTVELRANVNVSALNTTGNYAIYEGAQLWVNGGHVAKTGGAAIVPYGRVRVSAGTLTVNEDSGLTLRDNGIIQVEGGIVTVRAIRTSTLGVGAVGSYIQSGGNVILTGNVVSTDFAAFSLTYTGNVFNMSGGTLTIRNRVDLGALNLRGAIFINSDPANVNVTGGTVIMEANNGINYRITSRAPFWNVILRGTGGVRTLELLGTTSGTGAFPATQTLPIQPLVVLNDFTVENNASFNTNNADITVGGNFEIQNGGTYAAGTNTTTINGGGVSSLTFGNLAATQVFNNLAINKTNAADEAVITTGRPSPNAALQVNGTLTISNGIFDYASFIASARGTVTLGSGGTIGKAASSGRLLLDGSLAQTLNSSSSSIHNLEINNAAGITLATGNLTVLRTLTLTTGVFNINTRKLTLNGAAATIAGSPFSITKMIQTSGNASDGGVELYLDANETLTFPVGVSGKYTPVTATFTAFSDDGLININPVNGILQTTNLAGADVLSFYWKATNSNFTTRPTVIYTFTYAQTDVVVGSEANYFPGKVLDNSPFTRSSETPSTKVNTATNVITFNGAGSGFTLEDANYTAGAANRFTGAVRIFYTRTLLDAWATPWTTTDLWTFGAGAFGVHDSRQAGTGAVSPAAGDIAVIGWVPFGDPAGSNGFPHGVAINTANQAVAEIRFTQMLNGSNNPTTRVYFRNFQFRPTLCLNNLGTQGSIASGAKVSGEGMFWNRSTGGNLSDPTFTGVDLGDFNLQDSSYMVYESTLANATYNNMPASFPNLTVVTDGWGNQDKNSTISNNITTIGDFELLGNINLLLNTGVTGDITVGRNLRMFRSNANSNDSGGGGEIRFGNTGTARTVNIARDLIIGNGFNALVSVGTPGTTPLTHTINLSGNFRQNTTGIGTSGFKGGTVANQDRIQFNLLGSSSMILTNSGGDVPQFYSLLVNKGSSIATTASFNSNFTIDGPSNLATKSLVLQNGLFIVNNASANVVLTSGGGNFNIPSTAGLEVRLGTVSTTTTNVGANITLSGLLRVSGGTAAIDAGPSFSNDIEYSNTGNATLQVTGGTLTVGGQVRRGLTSLTGSLVYTQSAGTVIIGNRGVTANTRGMFEVLNSGSQFNHSGGSFTILRGNGSTTVPSLWLEPASSSITAASTITLGNGILTGTTGIQSTAVLNNLTLSGLATSIIRLLISPLNVNGNVTVSSGNILDALGLDLTIGGNMVVDGTFTSGNNLTTFSNTGAAAISGTTPTLSFYNFTKTGGGTLTLGRGITVNRDLKADAGTLATTTSAIELKRHARIDATISSSGGFGLIFSGTAQQQLTRSGTGTGTLGIVTVNNSTGVIIPDGNGYDFLITNNLRLQAGVVDIGGSLLSLGVSAVITPVSDFSVTNMIQTNSSFTDKGVRKQFPTGSTTNFVFPVGQLYYTPVTFSGGTTGASGTPTITVRPSNRRHPAIVNDDGVGELPSPALFNDLDNVLQYYWIIGATNVANTFSSTMSLQYVQPLVTVVTPYTEADYIAARILADPATNPTLLINKFTTAEVNEVTNVINFNFTGVTQDGIGGDYFAGVSVAIPDNLPIYTTTGSGNVNDPIYTPVVGGGGAPTGARVIVSTGHTLTLNLNSINLYQTQINSGGTILIPTGSIGHSLGTLSGTGDLQINSDTPSAVLPAAIYDTFFACAGGGLVFGGAGNYEVLGGINLLRNLTLTGSGSKTLANNDITICNNLTLNSGSFNNSNNRTIIIQNDFLLNAGTFSNNAGTLSITRDLTETLGTFNGGTGGLKTIGRNLTVNGGTFTPGSGTTNIIRVNGNMNVAGGATITTGTGGVTGQRFTFGGSANQLLTGTFTSTRAFNRLEINNSTGLTVAGNTTINNEMLLTSGLITPTGLNILLLESSAISTPTAGSASSFVNGKLFKVLANGETFTFPIGKSTRWRSGSVNNITQIGSITWDMEYILGTATGAIASAPAPRSNPVSNFTSADPLVLRLATGEYWRISDGSVVANGWTARVGLSWGIESDVSAVLAQREAMKVMSWNGTNWTNNGGQNFAPGGSHTQSRGTFESVSTLSFSENIVTLGSTEIANPLPVTLVSFTGKLDGSVASLTWKTASEINNDYFEVQRSTDGIEFVEIGRVNGNGTTNLTSAYFFEDRSLLKGNNYYRLKQFDFDGKSSYSNVIVLDYDGSTPLGVYMYPNPTTSQDINAELLNASNEVIAIRIIDMAGRVPFQSTVQGESKIIHLKTDDLKPGLYVVEVTQGNQRVVRRLIIKE